MIRLSSVEVYVVPLNTEGVRAEPVIMRVGSLTRDMKAATVRVSAIPE